MVIQEYVDTLINARRYDIMSINEGLFDKKKYKKEIKDLIKSTKGRYKFTGGLLNQRVYIETMKSFFSKEIQPIYRQSTCTNVIVEKTTNSDGTTSTQYKQKIAIIKNGTLITFEIIFSGYSVVITFASYNEKDVSMWDNGLLFDVIDIVIPEEYTYKITPDSIKITALRKMGVIYNDLKSKYSSKYNIDIEKKAAIIKQIIITKK